MRFSKIALNPSKPLKVFLEASQSALKVRTWRECILEREESLDP